MSKYQPIQYAMLFAAIVGRAAVAVAAQPTAIQYYITDLGKLGGVQSAGVAINARGQVTGYSTVTGSVNQHGFLWSPTMPNGTAGTMIDLGTFDGDYCQAWDINSSGQVVAYSGGYAVLWTPATPNSAIGSMVMLGEPDDRFVNAYGINDSGQVAGIAYPPADTSVDAFLWNPTTPNGAGGTLHDLGTVGGPYSLGYDINSAGQVVGESGMANGFIRAFLWSPSTPNGASGSMIDLGTLGGNNYSGARAISDDGRVVGASNILGDTAGHAFLYDGVMHDLGTLGGNSSEGYGINTSGLVIGYSQIPGNKVEHAFLWSSSNGMVDLNFLIDPAAGWELKLARGINDAGQITGYGQINGEDHAYLLSPISVPEPATLALLALGLLFFVRPIIRTRSSGAIHRDHRFLGAACKASLAASVLLVARTPGARADIFMWEYINPANPSLGKQQSTTLAPDGAGVDAVSGANLSNRNLTKAYLFGADLSNYQVYDYEIDAWVHYYADLRGADLTQADLSNANLAGAAVSGTNLSDAVIRGAIMTRGIDGLSLTQLYSTASYKARDLSGIHLDGNDFTGGNFADQNLSHARLFPVNLTGSNLRRANLTFAEVGSTLTNANLSEANLSGATFGGGTLAGANFTGAEVRGATFYYGLLSTAQLYSTASYQAHDLSGVGLHGDYPVINLAGQNLTNASFGVSANLSGANFANANLTHVFFVGTNLTNANFSGANLTDGSIGDTVSGANFTNAVIRGATVWGLSKSQIYSTASYQTGDLTGIYFYSAQTNWNFAGKNLTGAEFQSAVDLSNSSFVGADLTDVNLQYVSMQNANFTNADLTGADLSYGKLTGANFTGADVRGAKLSREFTYPGSGISPSQLASTASYQAHDLTGIRLRGNDLTNANLANQNLTDADFIGAPLEGADLTGAEVRGAQFHLHPAGIGGGLTVAQLQSTASYQAHDLSGIGLAGNNLAGVNLVGQNLTSADFESGPYGANLNGADLSHANLTDARFGNSTLTGATLVGAMLANLDLHLTELGNANLRDANLSGAQFGGYVIVINGGEEGGGGYYNFPGTNLAGSNLSGANLANANFSGTLDFFGAPFPGANLTDANLMGADARGANLQYATMTGANTTNLIQPHGHIVGLSLTAGKSLVVRDFENSINSNVPIVVDEHLAVDESGSLRLVFDADAWGSTISFAHGIPVALGGTLELNFAPEVDLATQIGRTIDLFDWTGVVATGNFAIESLYGWDLANLYTTGEVTLLSVPGPTGDYNQNGTVDVADYTVWRDNISGGTLVNRGAGVVGAIGDADYDIWRANFGQSLGAGGGSASAVPEASTLVVLCVVGLSVVTCWRGRVF